MPEISRFYGIRITMNWRDHVPPHFHAEHGADRATVAVASGEVIDGQLPRTAERLVKEWAMEHQAELASAWQAAQAHQQPQRIAPLE